MLLVAAALLALLWANSPWSESYLRLWGTEVALEVGARSLRMDLGHWINDGLMAVFFLVIGLEVRRDLSIGELTDRRRLVLPLIAGLAFGPELRDEATVGVLMSLVLATALGWVVFTVAARIFGETSAGLPTVLDRPVDEERDYIRGPVDAPLTLVEYADFECPFCASVTGVIEQVREYFGDDLRYVMRHLPLPDVHPHAELAAAAAEAAGAQGRFWDMHSVLYTHQDELELEDLVGYAARLGLDVEQFLHDIHEQTHAARIREDVRSAEASGARATPTFFIGDCRHIGPFDARTLIDALESARRENRT